MGKFGRIAVTMPFGKYRNWDVADLPTDYIEWALGENGIDNMSPELETEMMNQLKMRRGEGVARKTYEI